MEKKNLLVTKKESEDTKMKLKLSRLFMVLMLLVVVMGLVACDKSDNEKENKTETKITKMKESEAYIDFDGVKLPIDITYKEFLDLMEANDWKWYSQYGVDKDDLPNEEKGDFHGECYLSTNCGVVNVRFMPNEDKTCSVLRYVHFTDSNISIAGITINTPLEKIKEVLESEESETALSFYLDDYLNVDFIDDNYLEDGYDSIKVGRVFFHMR